MPVLMVRNTMAGPTVLSSDPKGSVFVEWAGSDDPNGADVQVVPDEFQNHPAFIRAVQRGVLVIENPEDNPEIAAAIERQNQAWRDRNAQQAAKAVEALDPERNEDYITQQCVGPNPRGAGQCESTISVKDLKKNDKPPLCPTHEDLAPQYVPEDTTEGNRPVRKWTRVTVGRRERQE